ncbi:DNA replication complex GINS protein PSF2 [Galemys pyrenaicus]|uniref:DNA replication complex GINS protein PSF2 n=1 Tax=Galemys pyrenaicus TaxID=202257 RepID=A0A8J5ZVA5_GALPY|nr:DNA replication complex GINS protein PSF2 [Galemys pyrenaicus]
MDAAEVEFLAEKELVTIIPNFSLDKIYLIGVSAAGVPVAGSGRRPRGAASRGSRARPACPLKGCFPRQGDLGPFNPGLPVDVPLWLAINLKQRQKCRLLPPEWMDVGECGPAAVPPLPPPPQWRPRASPKPLSMPQLKLMHPDCTLGRPPSLTPGHDRDCVQVS